MKIVDRKTFLAMPAGTVYLKADSPFVWGDISIKHDTTLAEGNSDWYRVALTDIKADDFADQFELWEDMKENGGSYPIDLETASRDGMFEPDALFMIYEPEDVLALARKFTDLAEQATEDVSDEREREMQLDIDRILNGMGRPRS